VLFVETLGEPQDQRRPLIDGQRKGIDGDGFGGTHGPYSSRAAVI